MNLNPHYEKRERLSIPATIVSRQEIEMMSWDSKILIGHLLYHEKFICCKHFWTHAFAEFLYLFVNVLQESITWPPADQCDHKVRHMQEIHQHVIAMIWLCFLLGCRTVLMGVSGLVPLLDQIHCTIDAHSHTGQSWRWPDHSWVMVSFCSSHFWNSKVIDTWLALLRFGSTCFNWRLCWRNLMLDKVSSFVHCFPVMELYLHEHIAKKNVPITNSIITFSTCIIASLWCCRRMDAVIAFLGFLAGSRLVYPLLMV